MSHPVPLPATPDSRPYLLLQQLFREAPLYAILDTALRPNVPPAVMVAALLRAGVRVLQYRHKDKFRKHNFDECHALADQVHQAGGLFIVNDRADVAALCGADGVHLGQQDLPPGKARQFLGGGSIIGYSTHYREQAVEAGQLPVDYIAIGPIFATRTKQNPDPVVGLEMVSEVRKVTVKPLVAIGGINLENAPSVLKAGADAAAAGRDLLLAEDMESRARQFLAPLP